MPRISPVHRWIFATLKTALEARGAVLFDGKIPDGTDVPLLPGPGTQIRPHVVLWMGYSDPHPWGENICGPRDTLGILAFSVLAMANDNFAVTDLLDICDDALIGFSPPDGGVIVGHGSVADAPSPATLKPQRFARVLGYSTTVGASGASA